MAKLLDVILLMRSHEIALSPDFSSCLIKAIEVSTLVGDKFKGFREFVYTLFIARYEDLPYPFLSKAERTTFGEFESLFS